MTIRDKLRDKVRGTRTFTFAQSNWKRVRIKRRITMRGRGLCWRFLLMMIYLEWFLRRFSRRHRWEERKTRRRTVTSNRRREIGLRFIKYDISTNETTAKSGSSNMTLALMKRWQRVAK